MSSEPRHSEVAYVIACLRIGGVPHFLVSHHEKWNDWTLVGGHVEPQDGSWAATATREMQEELGPLRQNKHFVLAPIFSKPVAWGPDPSRSADNRPTTYEAQYFAVEFVEDPALVLAQIRDLHTLRLVSQHELERGIGMAKPMRILCERLKGGLTSIPLAWANPVERARLPPELFAPMTFEAEDESRL